MHANIKIGAHKIAGKSCESRSGSNVSTKCSNCDAFIYSLELDIMRRPPRNPFTEKLVNHRLFAISYGVIGCIQAGAGFYAYFIVMYVNGFWPSRLVNLRPEWDSPHVNDLEDSYGQVSSMAPRNQFDCTRLLVQVMYRCVSVALSRTNYCRPLEVLHYFYFFAN